MTAFQHEESDFFFSWEPYVRFEPFYLLPNVLASDEPSAQKGFNETLIEF